ncbi:hypothetical protein DPMN_026567 [Dreissena polymorpha]|uniref:Uncharacterized protein n=1 Tax=Dreissena polymorpha TaxID=45954 RepID=A0A9D4LTM2_DREPO|nr:hypothetical protein DPMN_026567 [Dreissena polymorpha]
MVICATQGYKIHHRGNMCDTVIREPSPWQYVPHSDKRSITLVVYATRDQRSIPVVICATQGSEIHHRGNMCDTVNEYPSLWKYVRHRDKRSTTVVIYATE